MAVNLTGPMSQVQRASALRDALHRRISGAGKFDSSDERHNIKPRWRRADVPRAVGSGLGSNSVA
jgi:hypothetical protein